MTYTLLIPHKFFTATNFFVFNDGLVILVTVANLDSYVQNKESGGERHDTWTKLSLVYKV